MICFGLKDRKRLKTNHCVIVLLDDTQLVHELHPTSTGQDLLDVVIKHLNLLETSYFGLKYLERTPATSGQKSYEQIWLDVNKSAIKQLKNAEPMTVYFGVKYYASDPCKLAEEITRYQFFLQCKQDILHSRLPICYDLAVELFAMAVQSELGDFDPTRHLAGYVSEFQFLPNQSAELERRVALFHQTLTGQVPATAELNFLERVKWLDLYGCEIHPIQYEDNGDEYALGLNPTGVLVLRNKVRVAHYLWQRIVKTKCQGRCFLMDVMDNGGGGGGSQSNSGKNRNRFGFKLTDKCASHKLRWAIEDHKSFYQLINSSATLNRIVHQQQQQHQLQQQAASKLSMRFRNSIRSALGVGFAQGDHQRLRSSTKSLAHNQHQQAILQQQYSASNRQQPTVVRMPSRRYSKSSMSRPAPMSTSSSAANGNGLPTVLTASHHHNKPSGAYTMVDGQRQQVLLMMSQFNQQLNGSSAATAAAKSQTLKPMANIGKDKRAPYYHMMMMMDANTGQLPDIAILPAGRHVVQPSVYRATSIVNGINQLGGANGQHQQQQVKSAHPHPHQSAMMQLFNTRPQFPSQYYAGRESPRSTKSAIAPSTAMKLASKKLARQQAAAAMYAAAAGYDDGSPSGPSSGFYPAPPPPQPYPTASQMYSVPSEPYSANGLFQHHKSAAGALPNMLSSASANPSPRSVRSARFASRNKSKSTNENLHLLGLNKQQMLLAAAAGPNGKLLMKSQPPPTSNYRTDARNGQSDDESDTNQASQRGLLRCKSKERSQAGNGNSNGPMAEDKINLLQGEDEYCCSRSDCSSMDEGQRQQRCSAEERLRRRRFASESRDANLAIHHHQKQQQTARIRVPIDEQREWNAIRKRHSEFSNGKGFLLNSFEAPNAAPNELLKKRISAPQQVADVNNNSARDSPGQQQQVVKNIANKQATPILLSMNFAQQSDQNSKAVKLLNLQRQQLHSQSSASSSSTEQSGGGATKNSSAGSTSSTTSSGKQQMPATQSTPTQFNCPKLTSDSTASSLATSGYYAGSNSTGSASADSDNQATEESSQAKIAIGAHRPTRLTQVKSQSASMDANNQRKMYLNLPNQPQPQPNGNLQRQQREPQWSPVVTSQNQASSLKYVSFDV